MFLQFSGWEVFLTGNWSTVTFVTDYFPIMFFPVLYVGAKFIMRVPTVKAKDMDFVSDVAEFDAMTCVELCCRENGACAQDAYHANRYDDPPPKNKMEAFWMWLVRTATSPRFVHDLTIAVCLDVMDPVYLCQPVDVDITHPCHPSSACMYIAHACLTPLVSGCWKL